jgi:hypothetical protein
MAADTRTQDLCNAALAYAARGWRIIPLYGLLRGHCTCRRRTECPTPGKHPPIAAWVTAASTDVAQIHAWWRRWPLANIGIVTGQASGLVVIDVDPRHGGHLNWEELQHSQEPLPLSPQVLTGGGGTHDYYHTTEALSSIDLAHGIQFQAEGRLVVAPPSLHASGKVYSWELSHDPDETPLAALPPWIRALVQAHQHGDEAPADAPLPLIGCPPLHLLRVSTRIKYLIQTGTDPDNPSRYPSRSEALFAVLSALVQAGYDDPTIAALVLNPQHGISDKPRSQRDPRSPRYEASIRSWTAKEIARARAKVRPARNGTDPTTGIKFLDSSHLIPNFEAPATSCFSNELHDSAAFNSFNSLNSCPPPWPVLAPEAYYGLAGQIVRTIEPHSEADPVALLCQLLTYFGTIVGRRAYYQVEATRHYANLYTCLIGPTAKGRKGTAYDHIEAQMKTVDTSWSANNRSGGCGSGEGLIAAVRDRVVKREPIKQRGKVTGYDEVEVDQGVIDKRLLVYESEFASVLKIASREGNILSVILRQAWETGELRNTVKTSPMKATGAHIALIAHITIEELQRLLNSTEAANGFGNRFVWFLVRRSKLLPDGGQLETINVQPLVQGLTTAARAAREVTVMHRETAAAAAWRAVYPLLSEDRPGLAGALLARAEAQVLRFSMLYALLDGSAQITLEHLCAALALWEYVEHTITYIFAETLGEPLADALLVLLRERGEEGLTKTQIFSQGMFHNRRADEIDRIIRLLVERGFATVTLVPTGGKGRHSEKITASGQEFNELKEFNPSMYVNLAKNKGLEEREKKELNGRTLGIKSDEGGICAHEGTIQEGTTLVCQDCGMVMF